MSTTKGSGVYSTITDASATSASVGQAVTSIWPMLTKKGSQFTTVTLDDYEEKIGYDLAYNPGYLGLKAALQVVASLTVMRLNKNAKVSNILLFQSGRYASLSDLADPTQIASATLLLSDGPFTATTTVTRAQAAAILAGSLKIYLSGALVAHDDGAGAIVADNSSGITGTVVYTGGTSSFTLNYTGSKTLTASYTPNEVVALAIPAASAGNWGPPSVSLSPAVKSVSVASGATVAVGEAVTASTLKVYSNNALVAHDNAGTLVADNSSGVAGTVNAATGVITFSTQPSTNLLTVTFVRASNTQYDLTVYEPSGISSYSTLESRTFSTVLADSNYIGKLPWQTITPVIVSGISSVTTFGSSASPLPLLNGSDGTLIPAVEINTGLLDARSETFVVMNGLTSSAYPNAFLTYAESKNRFRVLADAPAFTTYDAIAAWRVANLVATARGALYAVPDYVSTDIGTLPIWPSVKVLLAYANMYTKTGTLSYPVAGYLYGATSATSLLPTDFALHKAELKQNRINYITVGSKGPVIWEERTLYALESDLSYAYVPFILDDVTAQLASFMQNYTFKLIGPDDLQNIQTGLDAVVTKKLSEGFLWSGKVEVPSFETVKETGIRQATIPVTVQVAQDGEEWTINVVVTNTAVA